MYQKWVIQVGQLGLATISVVALIKNDEDTHSNDLGDSRSRK